MADSTKEQANTQSSDSDTLRKGILRRKAQYSKSNENKGQRTQKAGHSIPRVDSHQDTAEDKTHFKPGRSTMDDMQHGRLKKRKHGDTYELIFSAKPEY